LGFVHLITFWSFTSLWLSLSDERFNL